MEEKAVKQDPIAGQSAAKRTEEDLCESEKNVQAFLNAIPESALLIDTNGTVIISNETVARRLGQSLEEFIGSNVYDSIPSDLAERRRERIRTVLETKNSVHFEDERGGRIIDNHIYPILDAEGNVTRMAILGVDITDRVRTERALQEAHNELDSKVKARTAELAKANEELRTEIMVRVRSEKELWASKERYRVLAENVTEGVVIFQGRRPVFVNEALCLILGYSVADLPGMESVLLSNTPEFDLGEPAGQETHGSLAACCPFRCKGGREIWMEKRLNSIEWEGEPAVLVTIRDATDAKLRESAIQEEKSLLERENRRLKSLSQDRFRFGPIIGKSAVMQEMYEVMSKASDCDANVLIYGESGTGKELVARTIHDMGPRRDRPFVPVNCGAIPESLFESEFFGHRKGSFTGASADKHGLFDLADGGTLFLDEIGELNQIMQVKLLRAIEGRGYTAVGDNKVRKADVRIIAATNRNLMEMTRTGLIREDFLYRIHVIPIVLSPLREHREDIPLLVEHFLKSNDAGNQDSIPGNVLGTLCNHEWPGNVRELENVLKRYLTLKRLDFISGPAERRIETDKVVEMHPGDRGTDLRVMMEACEKELITKVLQQEHWHREKTAATLGLPPRTLYRKLKKLRLI
ncbi:MAG: sigma 54-interacting transcriptional regulator [Pseudomonadota bacterium]